jgi:hypothetical protein
MNDTPREAVDVLWHTLEKAYDQSTTGKGRIRHNPHDLPFTEQKIMQLTRMLGIGGPIYQVCKKSTEASDMAKRGQSDLAKSELLGAIIYAAAAYIYLQELEDEGRI